jgi:peptide/nickel transport system substrate-binding protein
VTPGNDIHLKFNDAVPFVPLWQLDRHLVISTAVKPFTDESQTKPVPVKSLDPNHLLQNISRWRVE